MHVLVTGGAGFIGSHTVEHLLAQSARVRVLDNFSSGRRENLPAHAALEVIEGDVREPAAVEGALRGVTHVLHLAAQVSVAASVERPVDSAATNVTGFLNVLDGARRAGVGRVVHASSAAVYGLPARVPLAETAPSLPISPYGLEKSIDDQYAALYAGLYEMSTLGLRYFNVYGPRQDPRSPYSGVISIFCDRLRAGRTLTVHGDGQQTRDFIYVADVALANARALATQHTGTCNVATGRSVSLLTLIAALAAAAGVTAQVEHGAERAGDIRHSSADNARLRMDLGLTTFVPLGEGLVRLWNAGG